MLEAPHHPQEGPEMSSWPTYHRGTVEDLDVHLDNFEEPVPTPFEVQVTAFGAQPTPGAWRPHPYRLDGLPAGRYDAWTRWAAQAGARVLDHVGEPGLPSFEVV